MDKSQGLKMFKLGKPAYWLQIDISETDFLKMLLILSKNIVVHTETVCYHVL
jgi:hypothetical protein